LPRDEMQWHGVGERAVAVKDEGFDLVIQIWPMSISMLVKTSMRSANAERVVFRGRVGIVGHSRISFHNRWL
jgi:hypothetical protein